MGDNSYRGGGFIIWETNPIFHEGGFWAKTKRGGAQLGFRWNSNDDPLSSLLVVCARCATSRLLCTGDG